MAIATGKQVLASDVLSLATAVFKSADETVNNSNVLQNDDDLLFAIGTNETWAFRFVLYYHGAANADIQFAITIPGGGATMIWAYGSGGYYGVAGTWVVPVPIRQTSGASTNLGTQGAGEGAAHCAVINGWVKSGGTAGNVQLQWAQQTAQVSNTIVMEESYLFAHKEQ